MKHEIKLTIEYDGIKVEKTVPVGNLYKIDWKTSYFGISPEEDCSHVLHDLILSGLMEKSHYARYCQHEQTMPYLRKMREMCQELCVKVKDKLRSL